MYIHIDVADGGSPSLGPREEHCTDGLTRVCISMYIHIDVTEGDSPSLGPREKHFTNELKKQNRRSNSGSINGSSRRAS